MFCSSSILRANAVTRRNMKDCRRFTKNIKAQGFYVLGFPANNFGGQEPGNERGDQGILRI